MKNTVVIENEAYKRLKNTKKNHRNVYIWGATGYGKTSLVKTVYSPEEYDYISFKDISVQFHEMLSFFNHIEKECLVIDDIHLLRNYHIQQHILKLFEKQNLQIVIIGRCRIPEWLIMHMGINTLEIIDEDDLKCDVKDIKKILSEYNMTITNQEIKEMQTRLVGNILSIMNVMRYLSEGYTVDKAIEMFIYNDFVSYLEHDVVEQWDTDIQEFLLTMSIVDDFTLLLAERLTGNDKVLAIIERTQSQGNFLFENDGVYHIRTQLHEVLKIMAHRVLGRRRIHKLKIIAGNYYELTENYQEALKIYDEIGDKSSIQSVLIMNGRKNPGIGQYWSLRHYYLSLEEEEILESIDLMTAMCMLYSIMMKVEESEYWYGKLIESRSRAKGGEKRRLKGIIAYLDIALPHRGTYGILNKLRKALILINEEGMEGFEFSLTNNQPTLMNGGKDFCRWSMHDQLLAETVGPLVQKFLCKNGKGIVHLALGESFYEKGYDSYSVLSHLTSAQIQSEMNVRRDLTFVSVGLQIRLNTLMGNIQSSISRLDTFRKECEKRKEYALLPKIDTLRCRLALFESDEECILKWMEKAPNETEEFCTLLRYEYLTKIRVYLMQNKNYESLSLISQMRYYSLISKRYYIDIELDILQAINLYRENGEWEPFILSALQKARKYKFVRIFSEEGAAMLPLLEDIKEKYWQVKDADIEWFMKILEETSRIAEKYPTYLNPSVAECTVSLSERGLEVLRLQVEGKTAKEIGDLLFISERTVKYHSSENYKRLGVSNKTEAIHKASQLKLL